MIEVIIDTREQKPWSFDPAKFTTRRGTLTTGDYALAGLESVVCVERKSLGDFVSTVVHDWLRFRKELIRLAGMSHSLIVVEATVQDVIDKRYESDAAPQSVLSRAHSIVIDHGIPVCWWSSRPAAGAQVAAYFALLAKRGVT